MSDKKDKEEDVKIVIDSNLNINVSENGDTETSEPSTEDASEIIMDEGIDNSNYNGKSKLAVIFKNGKKRVAAIAGNQNTGKTNNLVHLIHDFRDCGNNTPIYAYGLPPEIDELYNKYGIVEISGLEQLLNKKNCIVLMDEFQKLKLNDRRYKDMLNQIIDFIYHTNIYLLLSSPRIRQFNSVIGGVIEVWCLKSVSMNQCINGSQLKRIIQGYNGRFKKIDSILVEKSQLLIINDDRELVIECDYEEIADDKLSNPVLF